MRDHHVEIIDTTLGSLIDVVSEAALELCGNERAAYFLAGLALQEILAKSRAPAAASGDGGAKGRPQEEYFH